MPDNEPDFEISEASISGTHRRADIFDQPVNPRRRVGRIMAQISLLVVVALLGGILVVRAPLQLFIAAQQGTPTPKPTPRHLPQVAIQTDVTYGTITVNGKAMPFTGGDGNALVTLPQRHASIVLTAPPFQPITCTIDTTALMPISNAYQGNGSQRCDVIGISNNTVPILDMTFTVADLPPLPRQQLDTYVAQEAAQLNALQVSVPANEHYANGVDAHLVPSIAVTSSPLRAQVQVSPNQTSYAGLGCDEEFCPGNAFTTPFSDQPAFLSLVVDLNIGWGFFNSAGHQVAAYAPINPDRGANPDQPAFSITGFNVHLRYDATTGWSDVSAIDSGPAGDLDPTHQLADRFCQTGASVISYLARQQNQNAPAGTSFANGQSLAGCLVTINTTNLPPGQPDATANPTADTTQAWFLVHFGAVLAVNDMAHTLLPQLPRATTQEVTEVQRATQP